MRFFSDGVPAVTEDIGHGAGAKENSMIRQGKDLGKTVKDTEGSKIAPVRSDESLAAWCIHKNSAAGQGIGRAGAEGRLKEQPVPSWANSTEDCQAWLGSSDSTRPTRVEANTPLKLLQLDFANTSD